MFNENSFLIGELCYMDASASFEPLNTSITLFYISCAVGALPIALFVTSDELEITLEKAINLLKTILPPHAFFGRGPQIGPIVLRLMIPVRNVMRWNFVGHRELDSYVHFMSCKRFGDGFMIRSTTLIIRRSGQ